MLKSIFILIVALGWLIYGIFFKPENISMDTYSWLSGAVFGILFYNLIVDSSFSNFIKGVIGNARRKSY